jgi:hypothetical protein
MKAFLKKVTHIFKRHPLLYFVRYILLSKNIKEKNVDAIGCFNDTNTLNTIPNLYFETNAKINLDVLQDELDRALTIGTYLRNTIKGGTGIGLSSEKTLATMLASQGGVCSDFSQIFNIFCFINGIKVKEWGSVDSMYNPKFGHSFNEIYSTKHQKWIAIDIHKSIVFEDKIHNSFFSTVDLFQDLRKGNPLYVKHFSNYRSIKQERLPMVYSMHTIPFLIDNKAMATVDFYYNKYQNSLPLLMINILLILLRKNQNFIFVLDNYKVKLLPKYCQNLKQS